MKSKVFLFYLLSIVSIIVLVMATRALNSSWSLNDFSSASWTASPARAAEGPIVLKMQSTWPTKDIFHEIFIDWGKKVEEMSGGRLKIDILPREKSLISGDDLIDFQGGGVGRAQRQPIGSLRRRTENDDR